MTEIPKDVDFPVAKHISTENVQPTAEECRLEKQTLLRLNILLMLMTLILYFLAWLDRANVGNARIAGMDKDLNLSDYEHKCGGYSEALKSALEFFLPTLCNMWGLITVVQSKSHTFGGFVASHFFLGLFEGGLFPGIILYLSGFYRRHELQVRIALFFSAVSMSGALSGLLTAAIQQTVSRAFGAGNGSSSWKAYSPCALVSSPSSCSRTASRQLSPFVQRMPSAAFPACSSTQTILRQKVTFKKVVSVLLDLHVWILCAILFTNGVCLFGLAYFSPSIVEALGYSSTTTQLMTVPPYGCRFLVTMVVAFTADRYQQRGLCALATTIIALIGAVLLLVGHSLGMRYAVLVMFVTGIYSCSPCLISWVPNNSAGYNRRATAIAMGFISTSSGGILSTWIYPKSSAPYYNLGARLNLPLVAISMVLMVVQVLLLRTLNRRKETHRARILEGMEDLSYEERLERLGDRHPSYQYTY